MSQVRRKTFFLCFMAIFLFGVSLCPTIAYASRLIQVEKAYYLFSETNGDLLKIGKGASPTKNQADTSASPLLSLAPIDGDPFQEAFRRISYRLEKEEETENGHTLVFVSSPFTPGLSIKKTYRIQKKGCLIDIAFSLLGPESLSFSKPPPLNLILNPAEEWKKHGPEAFEERRMVVLAVKENLSEKDFRKRPSPTLAPGEWAGYRDRFSALLIQADKPLRLTAEKTQEGSGSPPEKLCFTPGAPISSLSMKLYSGPVDWFSFGEERGSLSYLLYDALWFWVRWISFGLFFLLYGLIQITGSQGLSILLLSLSVKGMMIPLVRMSDRWQNEVNTKRALMEPREKEIKAQYKGEARHQRILALYKELNIHPMYALKSFLSAFLQIPIFFAAYHALSENVWLKGAPFLWIRDLSLPDHCCQFPFELFYFGGYLNLLPLLMTIITIATAVLFHDPILSSAQLKKQKLNLYLMAAAFLILFYPFPAGMVLYWTMNNLLSLIKEVIHKISRRGNTACAVKEIP